MEYKERIKDFEFYFREVYLENKTDLSIETYLFKDELIDDLNKKRYSINSLTNQMGLDLIKICEENKKETNDEDSEVLLFKTKEDFQEFLIKAIALLTILKLMYND